MPTVSFPGPRGDVRAYLSFPSGEGPWPGVVVVQDIFGMSDDLRRQTDRVAAAGYVAIAPDLYSWGPKVKCLRQTFADARAGAGVTFEIFSAAKSTLSARPDCTGRVGILGFCLGGGFALLAAPGGEFGASGVNYGHVPNDAMEILRGSCPIVGSFGADDRPLRGHATRLTEALEGLGVEHDVKEYLGAGHSFLNQHDGPLFSVLSKVTGMGYREGPAADAWARIFAFFGANLAG